MRISCYKVFWTQMELWGADAPKFTERALDFSATEHDAAARVAGALLMAKDVVGVRLEPVFAFDVFANKLPGER